MTDDKPQPYRAHPVETRLTLSLGTVSIGWMLFETEPEIIDKGEVAVLAPIIPDEIEMTGAEYHTLREDCGLSLAEAAAYHTPSVRAQTITKWQNTHPPVGAAAEMTKLRVQIEAMSDAVVAKCKSVAAEQPELEGVDLYRYRKDAYAGSIHAHEGLPHSAHNRTVSRTAEKLAAIGIEPRIEYWSPEGNTSFVMSNPVK